MNAKKSLDAVVVVIGLWLVLSSTFLFSAEFPMMLWIGGLLGLAVLALAIWGGMSDRNTLPEWVNVILGVVLFISPWVLDFTNFSLAAWNFWIVGFVVVVLEFLATHGGPMAGRPHQPA